MCYPRRDLDARPTDSERGPKKGGKRKWLILEKVMRVGFMLVNRVAGALLMLCGLYALWNGIRGL